MFLIVEFQSEADVKPDYGFANTSVELDKAFKQFYSVLELIADLARAEGTAFQIANDVRKNSASSKRVESRSHPHVPKYCKADCMVLEEKDREEFVRTKRIKYMIKEHE